MTAWAFLLTLTFCTGVDCYTTRLPMYFETVDDCIIEALGYQKSWERQDDNNDVRFACRKTRGYAI